MNRSLATALGGLFDYAGMFPPAGLPLAEAFRNYRGYCLGPERWVCNRFVCPAKDLAALTALILAESATEVPITVTGSGDIEADYALIQHAEAALGNDATVYGYELPLSPELPIEGQVRHFRGDAGLDEFLEIPWSVPMRDTVDLIAEQEGPYAKVRCGGSFTPSSDQFAEFLHAALSLEVSFKLTAGLHHPFRSESMHGFVNAIVASALIYSEDIPVSVAAKILNALPSEFSFAGDVIAWNGLRVEAADMEAVRSCFLNIGSCSITEPLEGIAQIQ